MSKGNAAGIAGFVGRSKKSSVGREEKIQEPGSTGEFRKVSKLSLRPDPNQPRTEFNQEAHEAMVASIAQHNILQPLIVCEIEDEQYPYQIIAGERRWRAAMQLDEIVELPVLIRNDLAQVGAELKLLLVQIIENHHRENMNAIDLGRACQRVVELSESHGAAAKGMGVSPTVLSLILKSANLHPDVAQLAESGKVQDRNALSSLSDLMEVAPEAGREIVKKVKHGEKISGGLRKAAIDGLRANKKPKLSDDVTEAENSPEAEFNAALEGIKAVGDGYPPENPVAVDENQIDWVNSDHEIWSGKALNLPVEFLDALFKRIRLTDIQKGNALRLINEKNDQLGIDDNLTALSELFMVKK